MNVENFKNAIIKALSTIAGPFGFPCEFYLRLQDNEKSEKAFESLEKKSQMEKKSCK